MRNGFLHQEPEVIHHKQVQESSSNEWLEAVTDDIYNKIK